MSWGWVGVLKINKELEQENKALKQINEALEEENKINTDKIKSKCVYGDKMCWFSHETESENEEKDNTKDDSLIKRLVDMIEKLTNRIIEIEDDRTIATEWKSTKHKTNS